MLDDILLVNSVLCTIADHDLVFGRCRNKEPHSSGILLCRAVVVGYEKYALRPAGRDPSVGGGLP